MDYTFELSDNPSQEDLRIIDAGIERHNSAEPELLKVRLLCVVVRDDAKVTRGGAVGRPWGQCCELQQLWVHDEARDQDLGTELMDLFEGAAAERGCTLVYLDTFTFQARPFYEKRGYMVVLQTEGFTQGIIKYTMHKRLPAPRTDA